MSTINILTDFGVNDNYVGVMKAVILSINPKARIIDLCHSVGAQNILQAAFLLKGSFHYFPHPTIHLVVVDPGVGARTRKAIIIEAEKYIFVGPDNGVLSLAANEAGVKRIIEITNSKYFLQPLSATFHGRDVFAPVAAYLSKGEKLKKFGNEIQDFKNLDVPKVETDKIRLTGSVIHIDHFGNLVSNIERKLFDDFIGAGSFKIQFKGVILYEVNRVYSEAKEGSALAIFSSFDTLEISVNQGNARDYFNARVGDIIEVSK